MGAIRQMPCDLFSGLAPSAPLMPLHRALHELEDYEPGEWLALEIPAGRTAEQFQHLVLVYAERRGLNLRTRTQGGTILMQKRPYGQIKLKRHGNRRPDFTPLQLAEVRKMSREGRPAREIAELFGTSCKYVKLAAGTGRPGGVQTSARDTAAPQEAEA